MEKLLCFHLVDVLILAAGQQGALVDAQTQGQCGTYGLSLLCQNVASLIFISLVLLSPTSVLVFLVWCYYHYDVKLKIL